MNKVNQEDRNYILVFDSFGGLGISSIAEQACPGGVHSLNVGGAGFVGAGGGETWLDALTTYVSSLGSDDKNAVTDVMVFGGVNDYSFTVTNIINAMSAFDSYVASNLPNARITVCPCAFPIRQDSTPSLYSETVLTAYSRGATYLGWTYANGLNAFIHSDTLMQSDGIHPNSTGADQLGHAIKNYIMTGVVPKCTTERLIGSLTGATDVTIGATSSFTSRIIDNELYCSFALVISTTSPKTITSGANNQLLLATISNSYYFGNLLGGGASQAITTPAYFYNTGTGTWDLRPVMFQFYYDRVYISVEGGTFSFNAMQTPLITFNCNLTQG